jgi:transposase
VTIPVRQTDAEPQEQATGEKDLELQSAALGGAPPAGPEATPLTASSSRDNGTSSSRRRRRSEGCELTEQIREEVGRLHPHYGSREISRRVGLSRKVVIRALREMGLSTASKVGTQLSKLESYQEAIRLRVEKRLTTTRILREIRELGYDGGRTILGQHVHELRSQQGLEPTRVVKRRFETDPGKEMQVDWSPYRVSIAGCMVMVHALGCLLCASRKLFLRLFRDERQSTLLEALASAFEYFEGVAARLVLDNMATAVLGRYGSERQVLWHPRFLDFARHYGFEPFACRPRDPDRKGKKEKSFRLVYDDFVKGTDFESWDDLDSRRLIWLDGTPGVGNLRVHGTTRRVVNEAWHEEQPLLIQLPDQRFAVHEDGVRVVDADATLSMNGTRYTVPSALAHRSVAVRIYAEHFEVLDHQGRVAFSRTYVSDEDKGRLQIDKTHYAAVPRRPHGPGGERLDEALVQRFPELASLVQGLRLRFKSLAPIHYRALIRLSDQYGEPAFREAALRAQQYRRFDVGAIERILTHDHPLPDYDRPMPLTGIGPLVLGEVEVGSLDTYGRLDVAPVAVSEPVATGEPVVANEPVDLAPAQDMSTPKAAPANDPSTEEPHHGT